MKKITEFQLYATCPSENGLQIRQARFRRLDIRVCDIKFDKRCKTSNFASASICEIKVEIAGIGIVSGFYDLHKRGINLYYSFEGARLQDANQLVFTYDYFRYYEKQINLRPLEITRADLFSYISQHAEFAYEQNVYGDYYDAKAYIWNGTKPIKCDLWSLGHYVSLDLIHGNSLVYSMSENKTFYKSAEDCAKNNHIEVFTFG